MSITRKEFEIGNFLRNGKPKEKKVTLTDKLKGFFEARKNTGYKLSEVIKVVKGKENTINHLLLRLAKEKVIEHKTPYYIYNLDSNNKAKNKKRQRK